MFYKDKPIDWLLDHLLWVKICNPEKDAVSTIIYLRILNIREKICYTITFKKGEEMLVHGYTSESNIQWI